MPDQNDADSVCYNLFAHYSVYRVTRDAVPARVPSPFNQHPNRWSWTCWNGSGTGPVDMGRCWPLRRLKDNSLKIPNLKYIFKIALLRVIPTLTHYSDIVSDISSGRICGTYVLTYYLTFFSEILFDILSGILSGIYSDILSGIYYILILPCHEFGLGVLLSAWINANGLNIPQMLVSHVCTQWLPLPLIPQNGQVLNLRVGPEKFSGYWKNRILAQGLKKDVGGRFRYAVGLQSWVNVDYMVTGSLSTASLIRLTL